MIGEPGSSHEAVVQGYPSNLLNTVAFVQLGSSASIGQWNWITAATMLVDPRRFRQAVA